MPVTTAYSPPGTSALIPPVGNDNIWEENNLASDWELNANGGVMASATTKEVWAILTNWGGSIPFGDRVHSIHVRVKQQGAMGPGNMNAQLYSSGSVIGVSQSHAYAAGPGIDDHTFSGRVNEGPLGWACDLQEADVEAAGFGVKLVFVNPNIDVVYGVSFQIEYGPGLVTDNPIAESFLGIYHPEAESNLRVVNPIAEPFLGSYLAGAQKRGRS